MPTPLERIEDRLRHFVNAFAMTMPPSDVMLQATRNLRKQLPSFLHQELQKAREEERAFILQELALRDIPDEHGCYPFYTARQISSYLKGEWRIKPDQSELDQDNK